MAEERLRKSSYRKLGEALQWLVDLKDLKVRIESGEASALEESQYLGEKDVAWKAAREALAQAKREGYRFRCVPR